ncbi:hypothetical protein NT2_22_00090 [Caenibius tardaugens NBRC 16725]|uniref:SnoaL-like domain-containing protein n=1 Tax=Caenibius tardaugens NBRC 16725 TaxID=1219035 RepID=U2YQA7_9SPHN|nr:nuclear transport factor 2 family protein [Caenibius tardaugens]AZI35248.1 nuclear transport factor 2 family protein [Caenibius tardaugens NBRC 16725]GAD51145.1 hypothetical protein NT2_22_00090 [Caenibius tardaugens NBRC 16725]
MKVYPESEVRAAWENVLATREKIGRGEADWGDVAEHFTEDAVYIDAVWGRYVGREAIRAFMHDCMVGFEDWRFPTLWTLVKDNLVVCAFWSRVPGTKPNGNYADCLCFSVAIYAGDGQFCYETDVFNMAELGVLVEEVGWSPPAHSLPVPEKPDRNQLPPDRPEIGHWGLAV